MCPRTVISSLMRGNQSTNAFFFFIIAAAIVCSCTPLFSDAPFVILIWSRTEPVQPTINPIFLGDARLNPYLCQFWALFLLWKVWLNYIICSSCLTVTLCLYTAGVLTAFSLLPLCLDPKGYDEWWAWWSDKHLHLNLSSFTGFPHWTSW